jgi:hypothetical protein
MPNDTIGRTRALAAVAVAVVGAGGFAVAAAHAAPGNCEQWGFSGLTNIKLSTGPMLSFEALQSPTVDGNFATDARQDKGKISGGIQPNGFFLLSYKSDTFPDDPPLILRGDVTPDGRARGSFTAKLNGTWELATPLKCMTPTAGQGQGGNSREVTGHARCIRQPWRDGNRDRHAARR